MAKEGYIKLYRKVQDCFLWDSSNGAFDVRSAWIDLLLLANHSDTKIVFDGKAIVIKSGQRITSIRNLAERWHWSKDKVAKYLNMLETEGMIIRDSDNKRTLLTIVNYGNYQGGTDTDKDTDKDADKDTDKDTDSPQTRKNKNEKNDNISPTPYQEVAEMYNEICVSYPRITSLSDARKRAIKARFKTYDLNDFRLMFHKAEESDFLKGKNNKNWSANFDWLIKDSNMAKVLDGNYENRQAGSQNRVANQLDDAYQMMADWVREKQEEGI